MDLAKIFDEQKKGALALLGGALIFSMFGILVRGMEPMYGNYSQVAVRMILPFIFFFIFNRITKNKNKLSRKQMISSALLGLFFAGMILFFTLSILAGKIADTVFLLYGGSIVTALLVGTILLKEKLTVVKVIAIVLAIIGISMYSNVIIGLGAGVIFGIFAGVFDGLSNSMRKVLKNVDRNLVLQHSFFWSAILAVIFTIFSTQPIIKEVSLVPILVTFVFATMQIGAGGLLLYGFNHFDVNVGTIIMSLELVFAAVWGAIFFGEVLLAKEILGGTLIFAASILASVNLRSLFARKSLSAKLEKENG